MQWLIDLAVAICKTEIGYFDRGDIASFDWELTDLTADGNWHDLNLSAIVPSGARLVRFQTVFRSTGISTRFMLRQNGNVNLENKASARIRMVNNFLDTTLFCPPDADRIVEYRFENTGTNFFRMSVLGWWL